MKHDKKEPNQPIQALPEINVILKGISVGGDFSCVKKRYEK